MKEHLPNFKGKVISVVCGGEDTGRLIRSPHFEKQGGRLFIVGTVPEDSSEDNWMEDLPCAVAWDTVQDYVIFDSMTDYLTRLHSRGRKPKSSNKPIRQARANRFAKRRDALE
jgi:hypothetical protein